MFGCQKQFLFSIFLFSTSICGAVENGVYSCKTEVICSSGQNYLQNGGKDLFEDVGKEAQKDFDFLFERLKITDDEVKNELRSYLMPSFFVYLGVGGYCQAPSDVDLKLDEQASFQFQIRPRADFEKLYPPTKLVVTREGMNLFLKTRKYDYSGIKDGSEVPWEHVESMVTFRIVARDENFVIGELDGFNQENNPDNQVVFPLLHNVFVRFTGDRLVSTYMSINGYGDGMKQGIRRYRCEKL